MAQETPPAEKVVEFEGILRIDDDYNPDEHGVFANNLRFQKFELQAKIRLFKDLPFKLSKEVILVARSRREQDIVSNGRYGPSDVPITDNLKELYILLQDVGGLPLAVRVGTMEYAYGQDYDGTMSLQNDANHAMSDPDQGQGKGFSITIDKSVKYVFDKVEAGVYTSNGDLLKSGHHFDAYAFRVTKDVNENLVAEVSIMHKENSYDPLLKPESKVSVGIINRIGRWATWGEIFAMKNSERYPEAPHGLNAGVSRITGPGKFAYNFVAAQNTLKQHAGAYDLFLTRNWSTEIVGRFTNCNGGNDGCFDVRGFGQGRSLGFSFRRTIGVDNENPTWIGKKDAPSIPKAFGGPDGEKHNTRNRPKGSGEIK